MEGRKKNKGNGQERRLEMEMDMGKEEDELRTLASMVAAFCRHRR